MIQINSVHLKQAFELIKQLIQGHDTEDRILLFNQSVVSASRQSRSLVSSMYKVPFILDHKAVVAFRCLT